MADTSFGQLGVVDRLASWVSAVNFLVRSVFCRSGPTQMLRIYASAIVARMRNFSVKKWRLTMSNDAHAPMSSHGLAIYSHHAVTMRFALKRPKQTIISRVLCVILNKFCVSARRCLCPMFLTIAPHLVIMSAAQGLFVGNLFAPRNFTRRLRLCQIVVSVKITVTMPAGIVLRTQAYCHYLVVAISNATRRLRHVIWSPDGNC